ncbi:hypothetical protein [Pseudomonas sp. TNT3]|uniref:hypothetical protein n=1 Tax=Pseudomonas sp. TNT3 TaxID=2654097 RepID=UPI0013908DE4|nr:hypothetical protein [Pseudomonas sp. TNT3]KAI2687466.1 hypothetical protein GBC55_011960 [Pseudomonas sp. TNT3]
MDLYGVKQYLDRAKKLIGESDENCVRYACLELRFCFEIIAYRQLQQYGEKIPGSIVGKWKPDQIIKLLASFDPTSDQGGTLSISSEISPDIVPKEWTTVGESKAIPWKNFRKYYQTLGSYLHAPMNRKQAKPVNRSSLYAMISDIENIMSATVILALHLTIDATCDCGQMIFIGQKEFEDGELARCANKKCGRYWNKVTLPDGEQVLQSAKTIIFKCSCDSFMHVPVEDIWKRFSCMNCRSTYRINLGYTTVTQI